MRKLICPLINLKYFQKLKVISSNVCLSPRRLKFKDLPFLSIFANPKEFGLLENQYSKLQNVNWMEIMDKTELVGFVQILGESICISKRRG